MTEITKIICDKARGTVRFYGIGMEVIGEFSILELQDKLPGCILQESTLSDYAEWELVDELENRGYDFSEQLDRNDIIELYNDLNGPSPDFEEHPLNVLYEIVKKRHPNSYIDKKLMRETLLEMVDEILFLS